MRKRFSFAAMLVLAGIGAGCSKPQEKEEEPILPVQLTEARKDSIDRIITADGVLRALDQSAVMPKISAPVRKFYVNRGDHVRIVKQRFTHSHEHNISEGPSEKEFTLFFDRSHLIIDFVCT